MISVMFYQGVAIQKFWFKGPEFRADFKRHRFFWEARLMSCTFCWSWGRSHRTHNLTKLQSGNQTWQWKIHHLSYEDLHLWRISHCHVWFPEGKPQDVALRCRPNAVKAVLRFWTMHSIHIRHRRCLPPRPVTIVRSGCPERKNYVGFSLCWPICFHFSSLVRVYCYYH